MTVKKCPYCRALRRRLKEATESLAKIVLENVRLRHFIDEMTKAEAQQETEKQPVNEQRGLIIPP